jgi:hypothetical protein
VTASVLVSRVSLARAAASCSVSSFRMFRGTCITICRLVSTRRYSVDLGNGGIGLVANLGSKSGVLEK